MKLLNKNIVWVVLIGAVLTSTGCSKDYLQLDPPTVLTPENIFSSTKNALAAINGMHRLNYTQWYGSQAYGGISGNMIDLEVLGEDFVMTNAANNWFRDEYRWISHRSETSTMVRFHYGFFYVFIANANMIIANIDKADGPDAEKNYIKGQAYAYRAWAYHQLVQYFGKRYVAGGDNSGLGVSLVLEPRLGSLPRNTVEEVYTQVNADIDLAISLLTGLTRPDKSHINVNVAKGLKARIALSQQNWALAAQMASEARQGFTLMNNTQYMSGFSDQANPEFIWAYKHLDAHPTYFYSYYAYLGNFSSTNSRGNPKAIFSVLYDKITATDIRKQLWDPTGTDAAFPKVQDGTRRPYMTRKFMLANPANSNGDLNMMRASEMYLIEAEALARISGRTNDAVDVLYTLAVQRDPAYTRSTNTGDALIEEILTQRRIELWGEGFRFFDLKRLNLPLNRNGGNHDNTLAQKMDEAAGTANWQFMIPRAEIDYTNGVVTQNQ